MNSHVKRIGYWMSKSKCSKINWNEFRNVCKTNGFELVEINLNESLEIQGPFDVFLHKLTDVIALANQGDETSKSLIEKVETYIAKNPKMIVIDPLDNVRILLDRYKSYSVIEESDLAKHDVFTPQFVELLNDDPEENKLKLKEAGISYPFVCKPLIGHGSKLAHIMSVIFNEKYISDCKPPCVAQRFVNHNAKLYKMFVVGNRYYIVERPSLKNFYACDRETICFNSHDISKASSRSAFSILDEDVDSIEQISPDENKLKHIVNTLRRSLGMVLFGVDVIIENNTKKYAIIDINAYPGYDGYPGFFNDFVQCVTLMLEQIPYSSNSYNNHKNN